MNSGQILTLQFGEYSNFVGTHWWNIQEKSFEYNSNKKSEINHDVLYREGLTEKGEVTFTPRLLLVDLKGSLKNLSQSGELYEQSTSELNSDLDIWDKDNIELKKENDIPKNDFQSDLSSDIPITTNKIYSLDKDVNVWSDFLYTRFHPRTVNIIEKYRHNDENNVFDCFPLGFELWKTTYFEDEFADKVRKYIEECDFFQGYHVLLDSYNSFSGLSDSCLEYLSDEYRNKRILAFPLIPPYYKDFDTNEEKTNIRDSIRVLNISLSFNSLSQHSSLFVPMCTSENGWRKPGPKRNFYHTVYNHELPYHSSAIIASALDTFTLRHRMTSSSYSLSDLCADLCVHGRKAAAASVCLPFSLNKDADLIDCLDKWEGPLYKSLTPSYEIGNKYMTQIITLRGIGENRLKQPQQKAGKQKEMAAYQCRNINEMLNLYLACNCHASATAVNVVYKGLNVSAPFPNIFDQFVDLDGNIIRKPRQANIGVQSVPVLSGLHSGSGIGNMFESLHSQAKRIKYRRLHQFKEAGLEEDEFNNCLDKLIDLKECYDDTNFL